MRLFSYLRRRPVDRPSLRTAVGCRRAWTWTDVKRLGGSLLLGVCLAQFAIWATSGSAASPSGVCAVHWLGGPSPPFKQLNFQEESCDGSGHMVAGRTGSCYYNATTGSCKCYAPDLVTEITPPDGWTCDFALEPCTGSCCFGCTGSVCTGHCNYTSSRFSDGVVYYFLTTDACSPCDCAPNGGIASAIGLSKVTDCHGVTTSDSCAEHGGNADGDSCCADVDCDDHDATKCAPEQCNPLPPPTCSGNCSYVSIANGNGTGFKWSLESNTCTSGISNCSCPLSPAGDCPGSAGLHTSLSCGSTGATSCIANCTGSCKYVGVAKVPANTGFKWQLTTNTCNQEAQNCGCPSDPGGNCPTFAGGEINIACGTASTPCTPGPCDSRGGDQDADGVCKDVDCDDADRNVGLNCCKGTCTFKWVVTPCTNASMTYRWDGDQWKWSSGDCGACNYTLPTQPGENDGQIFNVPCQPNIARGVWVKLRSDCISKGDDVGKCICGQMPVQAGASDGDTMDVPCDEHCKDFGGDSDSDGCCYSKDLNDSEPSKICGCDCMIDPFQRTTEFTRRFDRLPVMKLLKHMRGVVDPNGQFPWDGILEFTVPCMTPGCTPQILSLNFFPTELDRLAAIIRPALLLMVVYSACLRFIAIFKT